MVKALILAAGQGTRLRPLADGVPKCLVELFGQSLLERQLKALSAAGISDITILGGYKAEKLKPFGYPVIVNREYKTTNMVATLFCAEPAFDGKTDVVISYGDIVYEPSVLNGLLACEAPVCLAADRQWRRYWESRMENPLDDAETFQMTGSCRVKELGKKPTGYHEIQAQYMGLIKVNASRALDFARAYNRMDQNLTYDGKSFKNMYMTSFLQHLIDSGWDIQAVLVDNGWLEVDTVGDLELYDHLQQKGELEKFYNTGSFK